MTAKKPTVKQEAKPNKKQPRPPSAFGTGVEIMCKEPDLDRTQFHSRMKKAGFDPQENKGAVGTAYTTVRKIVKLLRQNKLMEEKA